MITPLDILFKNKGMSAEKTRIQWQEKCSDCRGITGRKGLCPVSWDRRGGLLCVIQGVRNACQLFLKEKP